MILRSYTSVALKRVCSTGPVEIAGCPISFGYEGMLLRGKSQKRRTGVSDPHDPAESFAIKAASKPLSYTLVTGASLPKRGK